MITEREKYLMKKWGEFHSQFPSVTFEVWLKSDFFDVTVEKGLSDSADLHALDLHLNASKPDLVG